MKKLLLTLFILSVVFTRVSAQSSLGELYVNEESGFEINGPVGWLKHVSSQRGGHKVVFYKTVSNEKLKYPFLGITVDTAPDHVQTALDFANLVLPEYRASAERMQAVFNLLEAPHEIKINEMTGVRFVYEMSGNDGKAMKSIDCKFMKGNLVVSIQGMDYPGSFKTNLSSFEEAINSFKFQAKTTALAGSTRSRSLKDILTKGEKQYGVYINKTPSFSLSIPDTMKRKWYYVVFSEPPIPFYIVCEETLTKNLPLITSLIELIPTDKLSKSKKEFFQEIAASHEQWERDNLRRNINFINKGNPVNIKGLTAFERIYELTDKDIKYHMLYIFLDDYLLQIGLSTATADFPRDDNDFMSIINTFLTKQG